MQRDKVTSLKQSVQVGKVTIMSDTSRGCPGVTRCVSHGGSGDVDVVVVGGLCDCGGVLVVVEGYLCEWW